MPIFSDASDAGTTRRGDRDLVRKLLLSLNKKRDLLRGLSFISFFNCLFFRQGPCPRPLK